MTHESFNALFGYLQNRLQGADPATFTLITEHLATDACHVYYRGGRVEEANPNSLQLFPECDAIFRDKDHVFYLGKRLKRPDSATYVSLGGYYFRDKWRVYFCQEPVEDADPETFTVIAHGSARDKAHSYHNWNIWKPRPPVSPSNIRDQAK